MPGSTTELNLSTAVDTDDNADYLTISLANSLRTLDGTYNSATGHTHNGAHQGGPIGTIPIGSIPDGSITSAKIADGTIATADLANASVTNAKLASDTARLNLLTNGGFEIWQRGNGPFTAAGVYGPDRWTVGPGAGSTMSVSRDTSNMDTSSQTCAAVTYTHAALSQLTQPVAYAADGGLVQQLRGRTVSFSVRVRTSTAGAVRAGLYGTTLGRISTGALHTGDGTYQTLTISATVPTNETNLQVEVQFSASCTAYVDNAMLVVGSQPADYAPLHPADDLARCLRYYEKLGPSSTWPIVGGYAGAGGFVRAVYTFHAPMAVTPTMTTGGTFAVTNSSAVSIGAPALDGFWLYITATVAGDANANSNNSGYITAESNP